MRSKAVQDVSRTNRGEGLALLHDLRKKSMDVKTKPRRGDSNTSEVSTSTYRKANASPLTTTSLIVSQHVTRRQFERH